MLSSVIITACCVEIFMKYGFSVFTGLFRFKSVTMAIIAYFINHYKNKEYYYYRNRGISRVLLWTATLLFDFILFLLLILLANKFR